MQIKLPDFTKAKMKTSKFFLFSVCMLLLSNFLSLSCTCSAAVEKNWNKNQPEKFTILSDWDVKVENALVQYIRGEDGTLQPGYLGDDGIFYLFSDIAVLNGSEYMMTDEEKNARLVDKPDKIVKIKRPRPYHRILWKNGSYYPACHCDADNIFFVFLGFGHLNESKRDSGNPRGGVEPYEYDFEKKEIIGVATQEPIVLVQGPAKKGPKRMKICLLFHLNNPSSWRGFSKRAKR